LQTLVTLELELRTESYFVKLQMDVDHTVVYFTRNAHWIERTCEY